MNTLSLNLSAGENSISTVPDAGITSLNVTTDDAGTLEVAFTDAALTAVNVPDTRTITLSPAPSSSTAVNVSGGADVAMCSGTASTLTAADTGTDVLSMSVATS